MADSPSQSGYATLVDLAVLASIVAMAIGKVTEPAAWTLLGGIVSGRFGVSLGKTIERVKMSGGGGSDGGDGGGTSRSGDKYPAVQQAPAIRGGPVVPREDPPGRSRRGLVHALFHDLACVRAGASVLVLLATVLFLAIAHASH